MTFEGLNTVGLRNGRPTSGERSEPAALPLGEGYDNGKASAKKQGERGGALRDIEGVKRRDGNENVLCHGSMDHAKTLKLRKGYK